RQGRPPRQGRTTPSPARPAPSPPGTPRHGAPVRTRHRIPSINCRFVHFGGRPGFLPPGSSGASTAHCPSVRSARPRTIKVATRSPCRWSSSSLTHLPEASPVTGQRHAALCDHSRSLGQLLKHALVRDEPASAGKAYVLSELARYRMLADEFDLQTGLEALELAEALGLDEVRASVLITIGMGRNLSGDQQGTADVKRGLEIALAGNFPTAVVRGY